MFKKLLVVLLALPLLVNLTFAQANEKMILRPNGENIKISGSQDLKEAIKMIKIKNGDGELKSSNFNQLNFDVTGTLDTLKYNVSGTNFGFFGQDKFVQYFVAPADLTIKAAGFNTFAVEAAGYTVTLRLIKLNVPYETLTSISGDLHMGRYPSAGDGFNNIDAFGEQATGNWEDLSGGVFALPPWADNVDPAANTFNYDLWSDGGVGAPFEPLADGNYQWVEMNLLGFEPTILQGEVFGVVLEHQGSVLDGERVGVFSQVIGVPAWKYYENPRSDPGTEGWWVRTYTWDFAVAVELTGDRGPVFESFAQLGTTVSTQAREVTANITDDNPSGGPAGVASATLSYTTDGTNFTDVAMTLQSGTATNGVWAGSIPGQTPGTEVTYMLSATDVGSLSSSTSSVTYSIFLPTQPNLVIFDGQPESGYPADYYFGQDDFVGYTTIDFPHDVWAFGAYDEELLNNYKNVFEFVTGGPNFYQREALTNWLAGDGTRNYFLAGEEWLGVDNGFTDQTYAAGDFEYDILGVSASYNDVSYPGGGAANYRTDPMKLIPVQGAALGGPLYDLFQANGPTDTLAYDPVFEIGAPLFTNIWPDAFDVVNPANVDLMIETVGINGAPSVLEKPAAVHNVTANGNKVVFMSIDPLAIDSKPDYYWYGFSKTSIQTQTLKWFGIPIEKQDSIDLFVTYQANMELERLKGTFNPATDTVEVRGEFFGWGSEAPNMVQSTTDPDVYEYTAVQKATVGDNLPPYKFFYYPGNWEGGDNRTYTVTQADYDNGFAVVSRSFNDASLETVLAQDATILFTVDTKGAVSAINNTAFTTVNTVHITGAVQPLQWPDGGWPDDQINRMLPMYDDGTNGDATAGDGVFSANITFPKYTGLRVQYKYGINYGDAANNQGGNDNENGVGADHFLDMTSDLLSAKVENVFGTMGDHALMDIVTDIEKLDIIPTQYDLSQNYPNPFNPNTSIKFSIPESGLTTLIVYNTLGQEVATLVNSDLAAGIYNVNFDASSLSSGMYIYKIQSGKFSVTKKMMLMK